MRKKNIKEKIGTIKGMDLLRKTRGIQKPAFRSGVYQTEKDRPRDKSWDFWFEDDICWCADSDECENLECFRHLSNKTDYGVFTLSHLMDTEYCCDWRNK